MIDSRGSSESSTPRAAEPLHLPCPCDDPAGPAQDDRQPCHERDERRDREQVGDVFHDAPAGCLARPRAELFEQRLADLEQVPDDEQVGELGDRRIRVSVDRDDRAGRSHPDLVLDGTADPER